MNDSFLEDLGLVDQKTGSAVRDAERYITTRHSQSPKLDLCSDFEHNIIKKNQTTETPLMPKNKKSNSSTADMNSHGPHQSPPQLNTKVLQTDTKTKKSTKNSATRMTSSSRTTTNNDKKVKMGQVKLQSIDGNTDELEDVVEVIQGSKKPGKRAVASREGGSSSRLSDGSTKENNRPSDSSVDSGKTTNITNINVLKERRRISSENMDKKLSTSGSSSDTLPMLGAIKEIVSVYTKSESNKIMRMMQDLYINSQSNLMKQLLIVTDDLKNVHSIDDGSLKFQAIVNENCQLLANVAFLKSKVEELQKNLDDMEKLKQENLMLKKKIRDLEK